MTVHRDYSCDLCREKEGPVYKAELFGIYWVGKVIEIRGVREVEHHLCRNCIESIQRFDIPKKQEEIY